MNPRRLFTLGVLAVGCLSGGASAQQYPYNAYNPYNAYQARPMTAYPQYQQYSQYPQYQQYQQQGYAGYPQMHPQAYGYQYPQGYGYTPPAYNASAAMPPQTLPAAEPQAEAQPQPAYYMPQVPPGQAASGARPFPATTGSLLNSDPLGIDLDKADTPKTAEETGGPGEAAPPAAQPASRRRLVDLGEPAGHGHGEHCLRPWEPNCDRDDLHGFYVQGGFVYLQPRWHDNPAVVTRTAPVGPASVRSFNDFDYDWALTPRGEVGFQGPGGFGVRGRYMYFHQLDSANAFRPDAATTVSSAAPLGVTQLLGVAEVATVRSSLNFHLADLEAQQEWRWGPYWSLRGSAGGRYAYLQQTYDYSENNVGGGTDTLNSLSRFYGGGPTAALELRRLFPRQNLGVYAIGRGSLLLGRYQQSVNNSAAGALVASAARTEEDVLPMGELEAGVKWSYTVQRCRFFVSTGVFGQVWFGAGNSSDSSPGFNGATFDPNAQSRRDLMFLGVALTAGVQF